MSLPKDISIGVKCLAIALGALFLLTSCKALGKEGLVLMTDDSYKATVFATNKIGFGSPDGILWNKGKLYLADEGGVFFSDDDAGGVWEVDATGKPRLLAGKDKGLTSTEGIALAPDGSILVGDGDQHEVFKVTRDGAVSVFLGKEFVITKPESMVFDEKGNLYIADNKDNVLYMLDGNHKLHVVIDRKDQFSPETIFYSKGSLYITDSHASKLYLYTPNEELKTIAAFGGQLKNVQGVTVDERGDIYLSIQSDLKHKLGYIVKISKES